MALDVAAHTEGIFTADIKRDFPFQRPAVFFEKADHAAKVVVVPVTQNQRVERGRIDADHRNVVVENLGCKSKVDKDIAFLAAAEGLRVNGETPLGIQKVPWRPVRVAMPNAPLNREFIARLLGHEQLGEIVRHDAYGDPVNLRDVVAQRLCRPCSCTAGECCHHRRNEAGSARA